MRELVLTVAAAMGMLSASAAAALDACPMTLSLKTAPEAFVATLNAMPAAHSGRKPERKPIFGQCSYQTSTLMQFAEPPNSLCSIEGQGAFGSVAEILDSESTVISHSLMLMRSDEALAAVRSALGKIADPVSPQTDLDAWKAGSYNAVDSVYAHGDDYWIVSHQVPDAGASTQAPDFYYVTHVRRGWLAFARRDLNTCTEVPAKN